MTWEQRTLLLDVAMPEPRWSAFFATLAPAGLRPAEAFALRPDDLDFREQTISVDHSSDAVPRDGYALLAGERRSGDEPGILCPGSTVTATPDSPLCRRKSPAPIKRPGSGSTRLRPRRRTPESMLANIGRTPDPFRNTTITTTFTTKGAAGQGSSLCKYLIS
jgi:integrase